MILSCDMAWFMGKTEAKLASCLGIVNVAEQEHSSVAGFHQWGVHRGL